MSTTALTGLLAAVVLAVGVLAGATGLGAARVRAQSAADAAALAAVGAAPLAGGQGEGCAAARAAAAANGATLLRCEGPGASWSLAVEVEVAVPVAILRRMVPQRIVPGVRAQAAAVLEPAGASAARPPPREPAPARGVMSGKAVVGCRRTGAPPWPAIPPTSAPCCSARPSSRWAT